MELPGKLEVGQASDGHGAVLDGGTLEVGYGSDAYSFQHVVVGRYNTLDASSRPPVVGNPACAAYNTHTGRRVPSTGSCQLSQGDDQYHAEARTNNRQIFTGCCTNQWSDDDPVFQIGIGRSHRDRGDALKVLKTGKCARPPSHSLFLPLPPSSQQLVTAGS